MRLRVNLLDEGERANIVAPGLARVESAEDERGNRNHHEESGDGMAVAVSGDQAHPERKEKDADRDVVIVCFEPRRSLLDAGSLQAHGDLCEEGERAEPAPAVIADEHDEERKRSDDHRPDKPSGERFHHVRVREKRNGEEDNERRPLQVLDPPFNISLARRLSRERANSASGSQDFWVWQRP